MLEQAKKNTDVDMKSAADIKVRQSEKFSWAEIRQLKI